MIKKAPIKLVGPRPKSIIFKSESSPKRSFKDLDLEAERVARSKFNRIFDPDNNTWESVRTKAIKSEAAKDIASRTRTKQWGTLIRKNLTREGIFKKTISTSKDKPRFIKKWQKALTKADVGAEKTRVKTELLFTGRRGRNPLDIRSTDIKYITTKRFRKRKFDQPYPKHYSKLESAAHFEKQRMSAWFKKPEVVSALKEGRTTKKNVWKAFWKEEKRQKREYARVMYPRKK